MPNNFRRDRIAEFQNEAGACTKCRELSLIHQEPGARWADPLFHQNAECSSGILVVLEAPNWDDTFNQQKRRLTVEADTDPSGKFTLELLHSVGLEPNAVLFTNSVLCLPAAKNGKFPVSVSQKNQCRVWLESLIINLDFEIVIASGGQALDALNRIKKHDLKLKDSAGMLHDWFGRKLLPLYHPSLLGRVSRPAEQQMEDIKTLLPYLQRIGWKDDSMPDSAIVRVRRISTRNWNEMTITPRLDVKLLKDHTVEFEVVVSGGEGFIDEFESHGVATGRGVFYPKDGIEFFTAIPIQYCRSTNVLVEY